MGGCHGTVMPCIKCLEHIQSLARTALTYNNPVRPHTQGVSHQIPDSNTAAPLSVSRAAFQGNGMTLA